MNEEKATRQEALEQLAESDEVEVVIAKLVAGGDGLGRFMGIPVFVPRSAPGDRLRVSLVERHTSFARAEIVEVLEPGPGRREAPCVHFGECGGCDLQHIEDELQVDLKVQATIESLQYLSGLKMPEPVEVLQAEMWGYRVRTQLHYGSGNAPNISRRGTAEDEDESTDPAAREEPEYVAPEGPMNLGYFRRRSRSIVDVAACPVLTPELEQGLAAVRGLDPDGLPRRIDLASVPSAFATAPRIAGLPHGTLKVDVGEDRFEFDARCFFQGHRGLLQKLVERAVGDQEGDLAVDLYAGVGLFTVPLARRYKKVVAVEVDRPAARFARNNARKNRCRNVEINALAIDSWLGRFPDADRVLVDPPRSGISKALCKRLVERAVPSVTYVSCHPATLARDLKRLSLRYTLESLVLLDMFPQTGHIEAVAQLKVR